MKVDKKEGLDFIFESQVPATGELLKRNLTLTDFFSMGLLSVSSPLHSLGFPNLRTTSFPKPSSFSLRPLISASLSSSPSLKALNTKTLDSVLALPLAHGSQTPGMGARGAEADAMGLLLKERIVFLGNNVDDFVADAIISQLLLLDAQDPTKDIRLFINSPGGSLRYTNSISD